MTRLARLADWLTPDDDAGEQDVDTEFLREHADRYKYMTIDGDAGEWCRCDLCGRRFDLGAFPELAEHVAEHDTQGAAEIAPFEEAPQRTVIGEGLLEDVEEWRRENIDEVEQ